MSRIHWIILGYFLLIVSFFFSGTLFGFACNGFAIGIFLGDIFKHMRGR